MYPPFVLPSIVKAQAALATSNANKAFIIGEYDWAYMDTVKNQPLLSALLAEFKSNRNVSGSLPWSLFPHRDEFASKEKRIRHTI